MLKTRAYCAFGLLPLALAASEAGAVATGVGDDGARKGTAAEQRVEVRTAMTDVLNSGLKREMRISGGIIRTSTRTRPACGTVQITAKPISSRPVSAASLPGRAAQAAPYEMVVFETLPNGTQRPIDVQTWSDYYSARHGYLGTRTQRGLCMAQEEHDFPISAKAGDHGTLSATNCYTDRTGKTVVGTQEISYVVRTDPSGGLIFELKRAITDRISGMRTTLDCDYGITPHRKAQLIGVRASYHAHHDPGYSISAQ